MYVRKEYSEYNVKTLQESFVSAMCDSKIIKMPRREFIFRTCEDGVAWHLISRRIGPSSESFLGHIGTGRLCWG